MRLAAWFRGDLPVGRLAPLRERCLGAYDALDDAPHGPRRRAAWAAYVLVTYGDKLLDDAEDGLLDGATAGFAQRVYTLAAACLDDGAVPDGLPRWGPGARSEAQLRGMQDTLEAAYTWLAYDAGDSTDAALASIDACRSKVARLWVPRPTPELRGGIAAALLSGLDQAYALGLARAT